MTRTPTLAARPGAGASSPLSGSPWPGGIAVGVVWLAPLVAVVGFAGTGAGVDLSGVWHDPYIRGVLLFTLWQAGLSTLLSVGFAVPVARALHRRGNHPGRRWFLALAGLAFVTPSIVAIFGIAAVHGRHGYVNQGLAMLGVDGGYYLYGLTGILIAHTFFNLPLAARVFLQGLQGIPPETWRLATQLGMRSRDILRIIEWPVLRALLPGIAGIIFLLTFTSFAVVLTLGGGPRATTLEVAIYQTLRMDFDIPRAISLSLLQVTVCALLFLWFGRHARSMQLAPSIRHGCARPDTTGWASRISDLIVLTVFLLWIAAPLLAVVVGAVRDLRWPWLVDRALWDATAGTLSVALPAALIATGLALPMALLVKDLRAYRRAPLGADLVELSGSLVLAMPPLALGAGLFLAVRGVADVFAVAPWLVVAVNALLALPFALRILIPAVRDSAEQTDRLCASLGIGGRQRLRVIAWPLLRAPLGLTLALCAALSTGDLSVIALFGSQDFNTLPMLIYRLMGAYRMADAATTAVILVGLSLLLFWACERGVGGRRA